MRRLLRKLTASSRFADRTRVETWQSVRILFIGGFGSHPDQVALVARALAQHYDQPVIGVSFSEAQRSLARIADVSRDCIVITHSSGVVLCENLTPKELIIIAPSLPTTLPVIVWRGFLKTIGLTMSGSRSVARRYKIRRYHRNVIKEHIARPTHNLGSGAKILRFNVAELAIKMIGRGVKVSLALMSQDLLYPKAAHHIHIDMARRYGVEVHEAIEGHHDEFLLCPLDVMRQIKRL